MGKRLALIVGNRVFHDDKLQKLSAPDIDTASLASVLLDPEIGGFDDVRERINSDSAVLRREIAKFFSGKNRDDLLLLYFSGHGVRDDHGRLYLAAKDTDTQFLRGTAISSRFIADEMDHSRSRRQILILDCCHSGAFSQGMMPKTGGSAGTATSFEGTGFGRVVLTASDAIQYAWEGDKLVGEASASVFTKYLSQGLKTGEADLDNDGQVTIDELYDYVYRQVTDETSRQTPGIWTYQGQGEIIIANNPQKLEREEDETEPEPEEPDQPEQRTPLGLLRERPLLGLITVTSLLILVGLVTVVWLLGNRPDPLTSEEQSATVAALTAVALGDDDGDGLANQREAALGTDPDNSDTDLDGLSDGEEVNIYNTQPNNLDSDNDGLRDGEEVNEHDTLPNNPDSDGDGLLDGSEVNDHGTDPKRSDTDGDGTSDGAEVEGGFNPLEPPEGTPTPTQTPTPNITQSMATPSINLTPEGLCSGPYPPAASCQYRITDLDLSFAVMANKFYPGTDSRYSIHLLNLNRDADGKAIRLRVGQTEVFIPAVELLETYSLEEFQKAGWPECHPDGTFPCWYAQQSGDTLENIALNYYGDQDMATLIKNNNWVYDPAADIKVLGGDDLETGIRLGLYEDLILILPRE